MCPRPSTLNPKPQTQGSTSQGVYVSQGARSTMWWVTVPKTLEKEPKSTQDPVTYHMGNRALAQKRQGFPWLELGAQGVGV